MSSILLTILATILSTYISYTDALALYVTDLLSPINATPTQSFSLQNLPSQFTSIPDILSGMAQMATVHTALPADTTTNPIDALVNVYCSHTDGAYIKAVTGSGVIIDSTGVVLTNAHVAQHLLLEGLMGDTSCVIRTGNPATPAYKATLLYISPAWVLKNAPQIVARNPVGTGERDYALLYITEGVDNAPLPQTFPALSFSTTPFTPATVPERIVATGYPAVSPFSRDGDGYLHPVSTGSTIAAFMTFATSSPDVFAIYGTPVGEQGSSGGPVTAADGTLIGLITTRGDDARYGAGSLRALTMSYVAQTYQEETTISLQEGISGNLTERARRFHDALTPILQSLLTLQLNGSTTPASDR